MNTIKLKIGQNSISNHVVKSKHTQIISTSGIQEAFDDLNLVDDYFLKGGYKVVSDITCRNNIPCEYRKLGMQVMVIGPDTSFKRYILKGEDPCSNDNWEEATIENTEAGVKLVEDYSIFGNNLNNQRDLNLYFKNNLITLNESLDSLPLKLDKGTYTGTAQDLKNEIDGKASISHTHDISSITNLQTALDGKENISNKQNNLSIDATNTKYPTVTAVNDGLATKQKLLSSFDESILIETDGNIEGNISLFEEYFEQQECELNFNPIQIVAVYQDGIKLLSSEYEIILPKKIRIKEYVDENIQIEYTHLKL